MKRIVTTAMLAMLGLTAHAAMPPIISSGTLVTNVSIVAPATKALLTQPVIVREIDSGISVDIYFASTNALWAVGDILVDFATSIDGGTTYSTFNPDLRLTIPAANHAAAIRASKYFSPQVLGAANRFKIHAIYNAHTNHIAITNGAYRVIR